MVLGLLGFMLTSNRMYLPVLSGAMCQLHGRSFFFVFQVSNMSAKQIPGPVCALLSCLTFFLGEHDSEAHTVVPVCASLACSTFTGH